MLSKLSMVPVWLPLSGDVEKLRGRVVRLLLPDGDCMDVFVKLGTTDEDRGHCAVILADPTDDPRKRTYLTAEAVAMLRPADGAQRGADYLLDFRPP
jgi:hypothetical protein